MGYDGIIITDALNMKAIAEHFGPAEASVRAVQAGADILLMPDREKSHAALLAAVRSGDIPQEMIDQSVRRILKVKERWNILGTGSKVQPMTQKERTALEARLAQPAFTPLKNEGSIPPFEIRPRAKVLFIAS